MSNTRLFILWGNGRNREKFVLGQLAAIFTIVRVYDILWTSDLVKQNYSRLFFRDVSNDFIRQRGDGRFLLVIVRERDTLCSEKKNMSNNVKCMVDRLGKVVDKACLYATDTQEETYRMLLMLLGREADDVLNSSAMSSRIEMLQRDLLGAKGWASLEELFYVLNNSIDYLILRNWEGLPSNYSVDGHEDIDILVQDRKRALFILNARKLSSYSDDASTLVQVQGVDIQFDIRYVGDNYYDSRWELFMLSNRQLYNNIIYVQDDVNHFYSLLYHTLVHKYEIKDDYKVKLQNLANKLFVRIDSFESESLLLLLDKFMETGKLRYARPNNIYSIFNETNIASSRYASISGVKKSARYHWNKCWRPTYKFSQRIIRFLKRNTHL